MKTPRIQEARDPNTPPEELRALAECGLKFAHAVAENPSAPPDLLRELADNTDHHTRKNVAKNPSTPVEALGQLGEEFPREFLQNPVFSLLLLEDPMFLETLPSKTAKALASIPETSANLLARLSELEEEEVRCCVAKNHHTSPETLEALAQDSYQWVRQEAAQNPRLSKELLKLLQRAGSTPDLKAYRPTSAPLKEEELWRLCKGGPWARFLAASYPHTPREMLASLGHQKDLMTRIALAKHRNTPEETLARLAASMNPTRWDLVRALAENPHTPPSAIAHLVNIEGTLALFVRHPRLPPHLLEQGARDKNRKIRCAAVENPDIPQTLLELLATDPDRGVRYSAMEKFARFLEFYELLQRAGASSDLTEQRAPKGSLSLEELTLLLGKNSFARRLAAAHPSLPLFLQRELLQDSDDRVRMGLAANPALPKELLKTLAQDQDAWVRETAADHPSAPPDLLEALAKDPEEIVRWAVARHPKTPHSALGLLCQDENQRVSASARANRVRRFSGACV